jgi:hypothetical protein
VFEAGLHEFYGVLSAVAAFVDGPVHNLLQNLQQQFHWEQLGSAETRPALNRLNGKLQCWNEDTFFVKKITLHRQKAFVSMR